MCGIVAVITKHGNGFTKLQCDIFNDLLYIDALRGMDSTGEFLVTNDGDLYLAKEATAAHDFRKTKEHKDLLDLAFRKGSALVGHNRAATKGEINDTNAHPFIVDNKITLVHNGTLWGDYKKLAEVEVDSHAIAHTIHKHGDDVEKALQELSGAYALIWHNMDNNTLNIVRNDSRPLHFMETSDSFIWASEDSALQWIKSRHNLSLKGEIYSLSASTLNVFNLEKSKFDVSHKKIALTKPDTSAANSSDTIDEWGDYCGGGYYGCNPYHKIESDDVPFNPPYKTIMDEVHETLDKAKGDKPRVSLTYIQEEEDKIATENGIGISQYKFMHISAETKDNSYIAGTCIDHIYVAKNNKSAGYFLYAKAEKYPDLMIKVHIPPDMDEMKLLDMCLNNQRMLFNVNGKTWRKYDNAHMIGCGIIQANSYKEIVQKEVNA
jgi:Glutamine amidotransferase domain